MRLSSVRTCSALRRSPPRTCEVISPPLPMLEVSIYGPVPGPTWFAGGRATGPLHRVTRGQTMVTRHRRRHRARVSDSLCRLSTHLLGETKKCSRFSTFCASIIYVRVYFYVHNILMSIVSCPDKRDDSRAGCNGENSHRRKKPADAARRTLPRT